jgi:hypothetical protein
MPNHSLWDLTKNGRHATATTHPVHAPWLSGMGGDPALGVELRVEVGAELRLSELHRQHERVEARAATLRQQLLDRGWQLAYAKPT